MSQYLIPGAMTSLIPMSPFVSNAATSTVTLNAAGETCVMAGHIVLENPLGGSKTLSSAGGGKLVWYAGAVTLSNATTQFKVGIQNISTASAPMQGDGTWQLSYIYRTTTTTPTANAYNTTSLATDNVSSMTIANGDKLAFVFSTTARGVSDTIDVTVSSLNQPGLVTSGQLPAVTDNTTGAYVKTANVSPTAYIIFDDGTIGWFFGAPVFNGVSALAYNSGTATADEYGNYLNYPYMFYAIGIRVANSPAGTSSDYELLLYSDPLGTPVVERTVTIDATQLSATNTLSGIMGVFATPFLCRANTPYGITMRPTTANNVSLYHRSIDSVTGAGKTADIGTYNYAIRRLDNTGAFSDYNGGTAKTRQMSIHLIGSWVEQGVNNCSGQVGVF